LAIPKPAFPQRAREQVRQQPGRGCDRARSWAFTIRIRSMENVCSALVMEQFLRAYGYPMDTKICVKCKQEKSVAGLPQECAEFGRPALLLQGVQQGAGPGAHSRRESQEGPAASGQESRRGQASDRVPGRMSTRRKPVRRSSTLQSRRLAQATADRGQRRCVRAGGEAAAFTAPSPSTAGRRRSS
jgi:hypothetical protein